MGVGKRNYRYPEGEAIKAAIDKYDPSVIGYEWDDANPSIQLEPRAERGYIKLRAVKKQKGCYIM